VVHFISAALLDAGGTRTAKMLSSRISFATDATDLLIDIKGLFRATGAGRAIFLHVNALADS